MNKIINPSTPAECVAAMSLNDGGEHPYLSIFYTVHEGNIRFFGLEVAGTETVPAEEEGGDPSERLLYPGVEEPPTSNPDDAEVLVSGTLNSEGMSIDTEGLAHIHLGSQGQAVNFIQVIRYIYTMQAQLLEGAK